MTLQDLITMLEDATQSLPGSIVAGTYLKGVSGWDSMGVVSFVEEISEALNIELDSEAVGACVTVSELHEVVTRGLQDAGMATPSDHGVTP